MAINPFAQDFDGLPPTLPVFPLTGVLLLPHGRLPLNIFEPRYLAMVDDAMRGDRLIGMVQPVPGANGRAPEIFTTGCAGRITEYGETPDGRYMISLTGLCRFHITGELATPRGYRRIQADWEDFAADMAEPDGCGLDRDRLFGLLRRYFELQGINANWESIERADDVRLVTSLAMICPFEPNEKQALLEAVTPTDRVDVLVALIEMAVAQGRHGDCGSH